MTLPIDRTKYNAASTNQQPSITASSQANREALKVLFDTSDELYNYVLNLVTSGTLSPLPPDHMYRQGIINAGMGVAQRVGDLGSKTLATGTSAYAVDRIKSFNNGSGVNATVSQVAVSDLDGAGMGLQIVHAAAPSTGGKLAHSYTLEARDAYKWAGLQAVFALKVKAVGAMDQISVIARYKTSESAVDSSSVLVLSTGIKAISNLSWTTIPLVVTLPIRATLTNTGVIGFEIVFSKSTSEASGDGGIITELELIKGGTDLGFQPRSYEQEEEASKRYCINFQDDTNGFEPIGIGYAVSATVAYIHVDLGKTMRIAPSLVAAAADWSLADGVNAIVPLTAISLVPGQNSNKTVTLQCTVASGLTQFRSYRLVANAVSKKMIFDAEI